MPDRKPTLAESMYPHLTGEGRAFPSSGYVSPYDAWRKPQPAPNRSRASIGMRSLAERADADPWLEHQLGLMGLRRKR
jgi:hypothetical protein